MQIESYNVLLSIWYPTQCFVAGSTDPQAGEEKERPGSEPDMVLLWNYSKSIHFKQ